MVIQRTNPPTTSWTDIDTSEPASDDLDTLVVDLNKEQKEPSKPPAPPREDPDDDNDDANKFEVSKAEETEELEERPKPNRAFKRIKSLLGERSELAAIVQKQQEVIKELSSRVKGSEKKHVVSQREQWEQTVAQKESKLEQAMAENDPKLVAAATRELADAQMRASAMKAVEEDFDETPEVPELPDVSRRAVEPPEAAREWTQRNPWFFKDQKQHVLARTISLELTNEGQLDPETDEYWDEMDKRLAQYNVKTGKRKGQREEAADSNESSNEERQVNTQPQRRKGSPISSSRSSGGDEDNTQFSRKGNRVTATPTQDDIDMANRLNIPLKGYMQEKFKYSNQDYKGYVTIDIE